MNIQDLIEWGVVFVFVIVGSGIATISMICFVVLISLSQKDAKKLHHLSWQKLAENNDLVFTSGAFLSETQIKLSTIQKVD